MLELQIHLLSQQEHRQIHKIVSKLLHTYKIDIVQMGTTQSVAGDGNSVTLTGARISSDLLEDSDEVLFIS